MKRAILLLILLPRVALAFHAGSLFDKSAGAGGGGGLFYTGSGLERHWDCTACHLDPEKQVYLSIASVPAELFEQKRYVPGAAYVVTAQLVGEHRGLDNALANFNAVAASFLDEQNAVAGRTSGYAAEDLYDGGSAILSAGKKVGVTSWTFTWTAPAAGSGTVTLFSCVVDGDGASLPGQTLTDPWNDDVACGAIRLEEGPSARRRIVTRRRHASLSLPTERAGAARAVGVQHRRRSGPVPAGDLRGHHARRRRRE